MQIEETLWISMLGEPHSRPPRRVPPVSILENRISCAMKTLLLLRHAKSSWGDATLPDRERPLNIRGERDLQKMSKRLAQRHVKPDLIMSSPALRALATAKAIAKGFDRELNAIVVNDRLYAASADALIDVIEGIDDKWGRVMLVGHNPGITDLAHHYASEVAHMPTCAIVVFGFDVEAWSGLGKVRPVTMDFDSPKQ